MNSKLIGRDDLLAVRGRAAARPYRKRKLPPFVTWLLLAALISLALPATLHAQFTFVTNADNTITITGYSGPGGSVAIPQRINDLLVTVVGDSAFANNFDVNDVTIPEGVTTIGNSAFITCFLTSVTIADSVTNIEDDAFENCIFLTSIAVPNSVTNLGTAVFWGCYSLTNAVLPNGIKNFGDYAFYQDGSLPNLLIPEGVTNIGQSAFYGCASLQGIAIPNGVLSIGNNAFSGCLGLTNIFIPPSVTSIDYNAFAGCTSLTSVTIPNSVTSMAGGLFGGCFGLTNVIIPNSVTNISDYAFRDCINLDNLVIPRSVSSLGDYCFFDCDPKRIFFQGNAPSLSYYISNPFYENTNLIVYYLPGTTGWHATFAGQPTAPWLLPNPTILDFEPDFGVQTNNFGFTISWATNVPVVVEASTNLSNPVWTPVSTNALLNGTNYFSDPQWMNYPGRFYRLRSP